MKWTHRISIIVLAIGSLFGAEQAFAQKIALAQSAAALITDLADTASQYESCYHEIFDSVRGYHRLYGWQKVGNITFCVVPFGGGGTRLTYNFCSDPFAPDLSKGRQVEFRLLNVQPQHHGAVWWTVQSDIPGGADANRQGDERHKTRDGDVITLTPSQKGDAGFYLAGRWDGSIGKKEFSKANPNGGVLIILR